VAEGHVDIGDLVRCFTSDLSDRLEHAQHPVGTGVGIAEAATAGVHRQLPTWCGVPLGYEVATFAVVDETESFKTKDGRVDERVVNHEVVDIGVCDA
jgi:hypothetical protein